jgi:hypothetical protein
MAARPVTACALPGTRWRCAAAQLLRALPALAEPCQPARGMYIEAGPLIGGLGDGFVFGAEQACQRAEPRRGQRLPELPVLLVQLRVRGRL